MHLLRLVATASSRSATCGRWRPGETRSCFAMTEPAPGAGSDPAMLRTTARRDGGDWVIDGRKWFITGADGAAFCDLHGAHGRRDPRATRARRCSSSTPTPRACASSARSPIDRPRLPGRARGGRASRAAACRRTRCSARRGSATATRRCASRPRASRTACAGSGSPGASLDVALDRAARARGVRRTAARSTGMVQALIADSVIDIEASRGADPALRRGARRRAARHARVIGREGVRVGGGRARRRPRDADLRRPRRLATTSRSRRYLARCAPSASTTGRPRRTAGRSRAARARARASASGERPGRGRRHAGGGGRLPLPPLVVRRPLEAWLDASELGSGPLAVARIGAGHSNVDVPARARRRAHGAAPAAATAAAALGPRHAARGAVLTALAGRGPACRACSRLRGPAVLGVPFYVMEELEGDVVTDRCRPPSTRRRSAARSGTTSSTPWSALFTSVDVDSAAQGVDELVAMPRRAPPARERAAAARSVSASPAQLLHDVERDAEHVGFGAHGEHARHARAAPQAPAARAPRAACRAPTAAAAGAARGAAPCARLALERGTSRSSGPPPMRCRGERHREPSPCASSQASSGRRTTSGGSGSAGRLLGRVDDVDRPPALTASLAAGACGARARSTSGASRSARRRCGRPAPRGVARQRQVVAGPEAAADLQRAVDDAPDRLRRRTPWRPTSRCAPRRPRRAPRRMRGSARGRPRCRSRESATSACTMPCSSSGRPNASRVARPSSAMSSARRASPSQRMQCVSRAGARRTWA